MTDNKWGGNNALKLKYGDDPVRVNVTIPAAHKAYLESIGGISKGVRALVDAELENSATPKPEGFSADYLQKLITAAAAARQRGVSDAMVLKAIESAEG